ncbi:hypothetical protein [Nocardioides sp.]|uniref:hypothetical protein n=1 Tax=Nocardioides sp. TaxID=35761 RepID=UPI0039E2B54D
MARRVILHVGLMKSGTTFLQALLFANQQRLAEQGVLVPGEEWGEQVRGVRDLLVKPGAEPGPQLTWRALVDQIERWDGTAVISMEFMGAFRESQAAAAVASFPPGTVEVVVTARDLNRSLASMWQETVQNGRGWSWADYLEGAKGARPRPRLDPAKRTEAGRTFWRQQDLERVVRRWGDVAGIDHVTVVTVPPPGAPAVTLTERFARVVGFDPEELAAGTSDNASVGAASAELLQRVNARLAELGIDAATGKPLRKELLAKRVLGPRAKHEQRLGLPVARWVRRHAAGMVEAVQGSGCRLEGAWNDLTPVDVPGVDPRRVPPAELVAAGHDGFTGLRELLAQRGVAELPDWPAAATPETAVAALADLVRRGLGQ